jgi:hypothetical protein
MYKCIFVKLLWKDLDKKRLYRTLEKEITLSFVPAIAMEVGEGEWFSGKIERIVWDNEDQQFTLKVADITPKEGISAELLSDIAQKQGWVFRE